MNGDDVYSRKQSADRPNDHLLSRSPAARERDVNHILNGDLANHKLISRRRRNKIFGAGLFSDPAYDILLAMYANGVWGGPVSVATACTFADVPESTALRYVRLLIEKGYLERAPHPHDKRITNVILSSVATERVASWLTRFLKSLKE